MDVGQEGGVSGEGGTGRGVEGDEGGHHQPLVLVPGLVVDDDGVDRVPLDPGRPGAAHTGHGVEGDLVRVVGASEHNLGEEEGSAYWGARGKARGGTYSREKQGEELIVRLRGKGGVEEEEAATNRAYWLGLREYM